MIMKKKYLLSGSALILFLSGCGGSSGTVPAEETEKETAAETASAELTEPEPDETALAKEKGDFLGHASETVVVDQDGIRFVVKDGIIRHQTWGGPTLQYTLENNSEEELYIEIVGTVNGIEVRGCRLQPFGNNGRIEKIAPGETAEGNLVLSNYYYPFFCGDGIWQLELNPRFLKYDQYLQGKEEVYLDGGTVSVPTDVEPYEINGQVIYEDEHMKIKALGLTTVYNGPDPIPVLIVYIDNDEERKYEFTLADAELNGIRLDENKLSGYIENGKKCISILLLPEEVMGEAEKGMTIRGEFRGRYLAGESTDIYDTDAVPFELSFDTIAGLD